MPVRRFYARALIVIGVIVLVLLLRLFVG